MNKGIGVLLRDGAAAVDAEIQAALAEQGFDEIQPGHHTLLRHLGEDGARPSELAAKAGVTRQAVTKTLDDLERLDLVVREPDPADGRGVVVRYTPRGLAGLQVARNCMNQIERRFASDVGGQRWRTVRDVLEALFDAAGASRPHS
ncbi:MAG: MarR family winged helix-turn-helix transcriptional regulator [Solirubrobacteraceae bacterium]